MRSDERVAVIAKVVQERARAVVCERVVVVAEHDRVERGEVMVEKVVWRVAHRGICDAGHDPVRFSVRFTTPC
jgi:hypothetical protein